MDPVTARMRASWLLDESALQPPALPPSAIVCIRRLADPRPGLITLDRAQLPPREWNDAVAASVAALARGAARPAHGEATTDAEAVIFADRAEMLACLAADWCAGRLTGLWWWRALLHDVGDARAVLRAWLETPAYIAAAVDELASRGAAATFVERLSAANTRALLDAIVVQHGLTWLAPALEPLSRSDSTRTDTTAGDHARDPIAQLAYRGPELARIRQAPWTGWVPESQPQVHRVDQQSLLGVALMTRRAPALVRTARFAADVQRWCIDARRAEAPSHIATEAASVPSHDESHLDRNTPTPRVQDDAHTASLGVQTRNDWTDAKDGNGGKGREAGQDCRPPPRSEDESPTQSTARGPKHIAARPDDRGTVAQVGALAPERPVARSNDTSMIAGALEAHAAPVEPRAPAHIQRAYPASIETDVGGVFYLLNVALSLKLYGDFTTPLQPGIELSIWDFLTLAGRRLTPPRFRSDALWGLLGRMGGMGRKSGMGRTGGKDWMRRLLPRVRARLALALPGLDQRRIGTLVCVHRARIVTSPTHVDVMFSLAELPIELRLNGLDRNPGWVPAADRVIAFHYE